MDDPRYPIGRYAWPAAVSAADRAGWLLELAAAPAALREAVEGLADEQLDTPYRDGGWTVRQLVHHVADSHMNAYVRLKLALTEDGPTIKPYDEARWAELADSALPIEPSLRLLDALHERWVAVLRALGPGDHGRVVHHPEHPAPMSVDRLTALYAWHGRHHVAHVTGLREREGWQ